MKLNCIAIDDEPLALQVINVYIKKIPFLNSFGLFQNPLDALDTLKNNAIDIVFLDIQMPELNGIEFLQSLPKAPKIIFTTSYPEFALQGFDLGVCDYLLKPISFDRFMRAVNKISNSGSDNIHIEPVHANKTWVIQDDRFIFVKTDGKNVKIYLRDIQYVEGLKEYVMFYLTHERVVSLLKLKTLEDELPSNEFIRVHRSFIVSIDKIDFVEKARIFMHKKWIPIGASYKIAIDELVNSHKIS